MSGFRGRSNRGEEKVKLTKDSYKKARRLFAYLKPYRMRFALGMVFLFGSSSMGLLFPYLLGNLLGAGGAESYSGEVTDLNLDNINALAFMLFVLLFINAIFSFFRIYVVAGVTERMLINLRADTYEHIIRLPMNFFNTRRIGELNSRISADIGQIQSTINTTFPEFVRQIILIVGGVIFLLFLSWKLTLIMLASLPIIVIGAVIFGRYIKKLSKQAQNDVAESNTIVEETLTAIASVKSFANELFEIARYKKRIENIKKVTIKAAVFRGLLASFIIFFIFGAIVLVIWQGAELVKYDGFGQQEFNSFILFTVFIGASFGGIADLYAQLQKTIGATEELMDILDEQVEDHDLVSTDRLTSEISGNLQFNGVSFAYPSREELTVLKSLNFQVKQGQQVAVVGPSGAGKSTLVSMLLRFYDPTEGSITIDGHNANSYDLEHLRNQMAIVPQEVILFGGTIRENIAYGNPEASEEEVMEAAKKANAHEFIMSFPEGYDTLVGERGIQLSGGQRQRIAIARAVLKDPVILILDEATSSLDSESERLVQEALDTLMEGRTSVIIAHRLSTIRNADNILVIDQGELKETGTHDELITRENGIYANLSKLQFESNVTA